MSMVPLISSLDSRGSKIGDLSLLILLSGLIYLYSFGIVRFIKWDFVGMLDGHSDLVTPDPVPNSEVKLVVFVLVLSLMGRRGAVCFIFFNYYIIN